MQTPVEMELPLGFRFCPTDEEAIQHYLKKKVMKMPFPYDGIVLERNPYDEKQLPDIFAAAEKRDIYFFTKLTRKGRAIDGRNFSRSVGNGTWCSDRNDEIKDERGLLIGIARTLGFSTDKGSKKTKLTMTEYVQPTNDTSLPYDPSKDWVLCRVKWNGKSKDGSKNSGCNSPSNPSSSPMVNNNSYAPEVEATPSLSMGAVPESCTYVGNCSPGVFDAFLPMDCLANNAAAYYSSDPSMVVVNGNSYTSEVEEPALPAGVENSVQYDDSLQLIDTLPFPPIFNFDATPIAGFPFSAGDGFPPLTDFDTLTGMDQVMDDYNPAATPITDHIPVPTTGDEFPVVESIVPIEYIDFGVSDTLQPITETNQPSNWTAAESTEPFMVMNVTTDQGQFWTDDMQFTPSFHS